jgi:hypothetical protein
MTSTFTPGNVVHVCRDHDAACCEVPVGLRCATCPLGGLSSIKRLLWLIDNEPLPEATCRESWVKNWRRAVAEARALAGGVPEQFKDGFDKVAMTAEEAHTVFGNVGVEESCAFPDCGCDGARLCQAKKPSDVAFALNVEGKNSNGGSAVPSGVDLPDEPNKKGGA